MQQVVLSVPLPETAEVVVGIAGGPAADLGSAFFPLLPCRYCTDQVTDTLFFGLRKVGAQRELITEPFK